MALPILAFVDRIAVSPEVRFSFHDNFTVQVGTSMSPSTLRRATSWTHLIDGEVDTATSMANQQLEVALGAYKGTPDTQAATISALARELDRAENWLMWQPVDLSEPVFFKTFRADMSVIDLLLTRRPKREVTCNIPADFAAFGLPVYGTETVKNDPTLAAADNPMMFVVDDVQGDVATPLMLKIGDPIMGGISWTPNLDVSVAGLPADAAMDTLPWTKSYGMGPQAGWTFNTIAAPSSMGGDYYEVVRNSGATEVQGILNINVEEPGNYRVLAAIEEGLYGDATASFQQLDGASGTTGVIVTEKLDTNGSWVDFGVHRFPRFWPMLDTAAAIEFQKDVTTYPVCQAYLTLRAPTAGTQMVVRGVVLVPAGLDAAEVNTYLKATTVSNIDDAARFVIDGMSQQTYLRVGTTIPAQSPTRGVAGWPRLAPGRKNIVSLARGVGGVIAPNADRSLIADYVYYPRWRYQHGPA